MILRIITIFCLLFASLYFGIYLQQDPGYVLIMIHHWTIESTFWVAAAVIIILSVLLHTICAITKNIAGIPRYLREWRNDLRLSRAQAKTNRGLIEFTEGHWHTAKKHLIAAAPNVDLPLVNYLTAAKAAGKLGDHPLRDHYLHQAQAVAPNATIAIELTQAQLQVDNQEWNEALATLNALQIITPDHPYVLQLYLQVYQATQNWPALLEILPKLKSSKSLSDLDIQQMKRQAFLDMLKTLLANSGSTPDSKSSLLNIPHDLKHDPEIIAEYGRYFIHHHQDQLAEKLIRDCLKKNRNNDLIAVYSQLNPKLIRIAFIESLLRQEPDSAALHLCLGQVFLAQEMWGAAKTHLEKSLQIQPTSQAYYALGNLLQKLNQQQEACDMYRRGLEIACRP